MDLERQLPQQDVLRRDAAELGESEFCARWPDPVLWILPLAGEGTQMAPAGDDTQPLPPLEDYAQTLMAADSAVANRDLLSNYEGRVLVLRKREGNPFPDMITIGRAMTNDLCVMIDSISKSHAYVLREESGWSVADSGSTNGTFLDGERLAKRKPQRLVPGATVTLGKDFATCFLLPSSLYARLTR